MNSSVKASYGAWGGGETTKLWAWTIVKLHN
jgi:hypothetical protein